MWSIGIYEGESAFRIGCPEGLQNPVISATDVIGIRAGFVADPFMVLEGGRWLMFFEVMNLEAGKGEIGLASSTDGLKWTYERVVLAEPYHLSYPHVFEWDGCHYMVPETLAAACIRLYRAVCFPFEWKLAGVLGQGTLADPTIFNFDGRWWMFACSTPYEHDALRLYYSEELWGGWREHPLSPVVSGDKRTARPAGRVLATEGCPVRFAQDCDPAYGTQVRAFEIIELSPALYREVERPESPILKPGGCAWNEKGMHHIDPHRLGEGRWLACVDGRG
jgi:hypothetical protein